MIKISNKQIKKEYFKKVKRFIKNLQEKIFLENQIYFGGGSAIALKYDEFRFSKDLDFLSSSKNGFYQLKNRIREDGISYLLKNEELIKVIDCKTNNYKITILLEMEETPLKIEILHTLDFKIEGDFNKELNIPQLSINDMFAQKISACIDRGLDKNTYGRDLLDLCVLLDKNKTINNDVLDNIENIYGKNFYKTLLQVYEMLILDEKYYEECLTKNHCSENIKDIFPNVFLKEMERIAKIKNFEKELLEF